MYQSYDDIGRPTLSDDLRARTSTLRDIAQDVIHERAVAEAKPLRSLTLADFHAAALATDPYLVAGLIADRAWSLVIGEPRSFKSMAAANIAVAVAAGADTVMGYSINRHGPVLYILEEGSHYWVAQRLMAMAARYGPAAHENVHIAFRERFKLDDHAQMQSLRLAIDAIEPVLVVIDTFGRCFSGDENSKREVQPALDALDALVEDHALACLVIHHTGKGAKGSKTSRARGSSAIVASTQATLYFEVDVDGGLKTDHGILEIESKDSSEVRQHWVFDPSTFVMTQADNPVLPTPEVLAGLVDTVIAAGSTATAATLLAQWKLDHPNQPYGRSAWSGRIAAAVRAGAIVQRGRGPRTHYVLPLHVVASSLELTA